MSIEAEMLPIRPGRMRGSRAAHAVVPLVGRRPWTKDDRGFFQDLHVPEPPRRARRTRATKNGPGLAPHFSPSGTHGHARIVHHVGRCPASRLRCRRAAVRLGALQADADLQQLATVIQVTLERNMSFSRSLAWLACIAGIVHAGFSLYWALGGRWLVATVGQWAVQLSVEAPIEAGLVLGLVGIGKLLAATIPVVVAYDRMPWRRFWRAVSWAGGLLLVSYGGVNTVVSSAVLGGLIHPSGGYDLNAMIGHAWLWDPLFLLWGTALVISLWTSRRSSPVIA
ncbi:DUF3995 domain-containing protein [Pseudarthrobacter sp. AG30]|uniref:DUF3995 domain-containing protein n=1 Tax=Pseudarthrobacter sp. AG30 TaxID=2249742 RepID=UPI0034CE4A70